MSSTWRAGAAVAAVSAVLCGAGGIAPVYGREIVLGIGDALALDQPKAAFGIEDPAHPGANVGPLQVNSAVLDTGANGILVAAAGYSGGETYPVQTRADGSVVQYQEIGAAGTDLLDVFQPVGVTFQADGDDTPHEITSVRPFGSANVDLGGDIAGLVGMPAMAGRVVHMDLKPIAQADFMSTRFLPAAPAPTATSFHVPLQYLPPEFPGVDPLHPDDPTPTFSAVPLVPGVVNTHGANSRPLTMLLDTGAQTSILSSASAAALGYNLDPDSPTTDIEDLDGDGMITAADYLPISGVGGEIPAPFIRVDRIAIPTAEGDALVLTDLDVLVIDIAGLDGIFGMNLLTTGYFDAAFGGTGGYGAFGDIYLDFTSPMAATMRLDVNPSLITAVPEPTGVVLFLGGVVLALTNRRRRAARVGD